MYQKNARHRLIYIALFGAVTTILVFINIFYRQNIWSGQAKELQQVVLNIRLTRTLTCVLAGAGLGLAGLCMQNMLKNPIATPFTLGLSSAANFGASLSIVSGFPFIFSAYGVQISAVVSCFIAGGVILVIFSTRQVSMNTMILIGVTINLFFTSLQQLLQYFSSEREVQRMATWSLGDLSRSSWESVLVIGVVLYVVAIIVYQQAWGMNLLLLSDETALAMGVNVKRVRLLIFFSSALVTAVVVSFVGTIGFVGLIAPHLVRLVLGADSRFTITGSLIVGALVLVLADLLSQFILPGTIIPAGIITSLVGLPFMCLVVLKKGRV
ncbi:FecCD family ABC transporter permease [Eupransor demetentiae]|uniref:Permease component (FepD) n=1 Tax=Eupransor demetentiae TaxID=3109584 RepID=A0ABM9N5A6_9LACO|nr:ABC-type Fe3+-siderophore transport system [Lactobacillaceae bacterium LMG 33000]